MTGAKPAWRRIFAGMDIALKRVSSLPYGEVDLIASRDGVLCFVEVKTRAETEHGLPREFVGPSKQRRIRTAAAQYLMRYALDCPVRFDVAEVYTGGVLDEANVRIEYLEAAFE